ncbi:MAG: response regulator [Acidobacteriota bacterium]|nr:response regulator [Acidobacteriota bacterium]
MAEKILCVDDDPNILQAYQRALRKDFCIEIAESGEQALKMVEEDGPYAVIVSDMRMPIMDGVQLLARVKELAPDSTRIMLTGNADQRTAIEAVNAGYIFRFLTKPCPPEQLAKALSSSVEQYRLVRSEKELLEQTLHGSIQVLTDILALVNPTAFGRASRVRRLVQQLAGILKVENAWQVEIAAMLSQIGCVTVPEETLTKVYNGESLTAKELHMIQEHPQVGHDLINRIPRLEPVAKIIAYQDKFFNGSGTPHDNKRGQMIPLGARLLKLALDYDKLMEAKRSESEAYKEIRRRCEWYDPNAVEALRSIVESKKIEYDVQYVRVSELRQGMILADDVMLTNGFLLIAKGQEVTISLCVRLENFLARGGIREPVKVFVPVNDGEKSMVLTTTRLSSSRDHLDYL